MNKRTVYECQDGQMLQMPDTEDTGGNDPDSSVRKVLSLARKLRGKIVFRFLEKLI